MRGDTTIDKRFQFCGGRVRRGVPVKDRVPLYEIESVYHRDPTNGTVTFTGKVRSDVRDG